MAPPWKRQAKNYYDELDDVHQFIVDSRLKHVPYKEINDAIFEKWNKRYNDSALRDMLSEGGTCYNAYIFKYQQLIIEAKKKKEKRRDRLDLLEEKSIDLLERRIDDGDMEAATELLDRSGMGKGHKVEQSGAIAVDHNLGDTLKGILDSIK